MCNIEDIKTDRARVNEVPKSPGKHISESPILSSKPF